MCACVVMCGCVLYELCTLEHAFQGQVSVGGDVCVVGVGGDGWRA